MLYYLLSSASPDSRRFAERLRNDLRTFGFTPVNAPEDLWSPNFSATAKLLRSADLILADVSDEPNDLFELGFAFGYAQAQRKPLVPLIDESRNVRVPQNLTGVLYVPYKGPDDPNVIERIVKLAKNYETA